MRIQICKEAEMLSAYVDCRLDGRDIRRVADHLRSCSACSATVSELSSLKSALHSLNTPLTPPNSDFWQNAYREARVNVLTSRKNRSSVHRANYFDRKTLTMALVFAMSLVFFVPIATDHNRLLDTSTMRHTSHSVTLDVMPLLQAHTSYSAIQPLADDPHVSMTLSDEAGAESDQTPNNQVDVVIH